MIRHQIQYLIDKTPPLIVTAPTVYLQWPVMTEDDYYYRNDYLIVLFTQLFPTSSSTIPCPFSTLSRLPPGMPSQSINMPKWLGIWGLFFLVLAGFNNWLCFSTITYETASYFNTTAQALNQVSIATFPFQIIFNLIGVFIADSYGPGYCFIICLIFTIPSSIIRVFTFTSLVETSQKYALFYVCQILNACGLASVTVLPTKLTSIWQGRQWVKSPSY